jgi:hypothetical protein
MTEAAETPQEAVAEVAAPATPTAEDYAALVQKVKSYEGRDQALTRTAAENKQLAADLAAARAQNAEYEQQSMSELEKAQKARDKAIADAVEAKAEAQRVILTTKYPLATTEYGDVALPPEDVLAKFEAKLAKPAPEPETREPMIDPNRAPRNTAPAERTTDEMIEELGGYEPEGWAKKR